MQAYNLFHDAVSWNLADSGIERPIMIDDDVDSPKRMAPTQGLINEKHRVRKRAQKIRGLLQTTHEPVDNFNWLKKLMQSSEKIVVISGASISISASCESKLVCEFFYQY